MATLNQILLGGALLGLPVDCYCQGDSVPISLLCCHKGEEIEMALKLWHQNILTDSQKVDNVFCVCVLWMFLRPVATCVEIENQKN